MYRYLVFVYKNCYPQGGMIDCKYKTNCMSDGFTKLSELMKYSQFGDYIYAEGHIYDAEEDKTYITDDGIEFKQRDISEPVEYDFD